MEGLHLFLPSMSNAACILDDTWTLDPFPVKFSDYIIVTASHIHIRIRDHKTSKKTGNRTYRVPDTLDRLLRDWITHRRPGVCACAEQGADSDHHVCKKRHLCAPRLL